MNGPLIFIVTGEPSGDLIGSRLMAALKKETGGTVRFSGIGGENMEAEGLKSLVDISELAVMGILEVLPKAPLILKRVRETVAEIKRLKPDVMVTIDSWGFTMRINKAVRGLEPHIPQVHYVAPMVWVWRETRAREIAGLVDHLMALLPSEPPHFEAVGLKTTCVGHPVIESGADKGDGEAFRERHGIGKDKRLLCMLPGSRRSETSRLLPVFREAVETLAAKYPNLQLVAPTVATVASSVEAEVASWPVPVTVVRGTAERYDAFAACEAAMAASGTVALELAMASLPAVVCYKVSALSAWMFRRIAKVPLANLINNLQGKMIVPELIQEDCLADNVVREVSRLLDDPKARETQVAGIREGLKLLGLGSDSPSRNAARLVLGMCDGNPLK